MYLTDLEEIQRQVFKKILNLQKRKRKYDLREKWTPESHLMNDRHDAECSMG